MNESRKLGEHPKTTVEAALGVAHAGVEHAADLARMIDVEAFAKAATGAIARADTVDLRRRSPAEMADQLLRDATSLEKDQQFYQHVAANVREAATFLAGWEHRLMAREQRLTLESSAARIKDMQGAVATAHGIRECLPNWSKDCGVWRAAAGSIVAALEARLATMRAMLPTGDEA